MPPRGISRVYRLSRKQLRAERSKWERIAEAIAAMFATPAEKGK